MPFISFQNADSKAPVKGKIRLKRFIEWLFLHYAKDLHSLTVVFCSDEYLLSLNRHFLQHDYYTDILTFDLSNDSTITGEIYISIDRVKENSLLQNVTFYHELLRIIFHGVLHLCGFKDKSPSQRKKMSFYEDHALQEFAKFHVKQE